MDDYNEAIRIDPQSVEAYVGRGTIYEERREHQPAIEEYNEALHLNPDHAVA